MDQTATGLLVIGWRVALAVIAGSTAMTTLGVFLLVRFTSVFDAYAGERAKLLAQSHNIDRLIEQTERLTVTTEVMKSRVSDEMWDRQQRWEFKRDIYIRLIQSMGQLRDGHGMHMRLERLRRVRNMDDPNYGPKLILRIEASMSTFLEAYLEFQKNTDIAPLVISLESYQILITVVKSIRTVDFTVPDWAKSCEHNMEAFQVGVSKLVLAAAKDLGYPAPDSGTTSIPAFTLFQGIWESSKT